MLRSEGDFGTLRDEHSNRDSDTLEGRFFVAPQARARRATEVLADMKSRLGAEASQRSLLGAVIFCLQNPRSPTPKNPFFYVLSPKVCSGTEHDETEMLGLKAP